LNADVDSRGLCEIVLLQNRFLVDTAADGWQAFAKATTDVPDIIVTETNLDGIDGYRLCELSRAERDTRDVPIVVLTSNTRAGHLDQTRSSGADAVLTKPCSSHALLTTMERVRRESRALRARSSFAQEVAVACRETAVDLLARLRQARDLKRR
jgi:DNA-binding response OmpR family regulator